MLARRPAAPARRRPVVPPGGWSLRSELSLLSVDSQLSALSAASILGLASAGSILSIGSAGSILSVGSVGSIASVGSVGSILSVGSAFSIRSVGGAFATPARHRGDDGAHVEPLPPARLVGTALGALALVAAVLDL